MLVFVLYAVIKKRITALFISSLVLCFEFGGWVARAGNCEII